MADEKFPVWKKPKDYLSAVEVGSMPYVLTLRDSSTTGPWNVLQEPETEPDWRERLKLKKEERDDYLKHIGKASRKPRPNEIALKEQNRLAGNKRGKKNGAKKRKAQAMRQLGSDDADDGSDDDIVNDNDGTEDDTEARSDTITIAAGAVGQDDIDEPRPKRVRVARLEDTQLTYIMQELGSAGTEADTSDDDFEAVPVNGEESADELEEELLSADDSFDEVLTIAGRKNRDLKRGKKPGKGALTRGRQDKIDQSRTIAQATESGTAESRTVLRKKTPRGKKLQSVKKANQKKKLHKV